MRKVFTEKAPSREKSEVETELFDGDCTIIGEDDVIAFVNGNGTVRGHQGEHGKTHAEVWGQETVAKKGLERFVVSAGILDAGGH